ncbi:tRNA (adenosine(37)-N6)-threonylcarbamoyltransferase complex ATPase subunit type 1 TsaE [Galbibacter sp. EGI 63066]|uniref:tRNA (adenosine(37)-N6)-threonylcarbamoyltransferase complex ATPase subunit type 1 TsaE n=1 Tax=Galbibacter sp. EGI 63066 TaxID=2993559 RepID=UPI002248D91F|nr:tRNA (adenosine(37)-N6)-threonylcarbamoyltransferase complex ATPase subunit type 1 TsaE [Galbibacter sp. EGI 63066]MCX2680794.1 tRNA (adenosine(37)-N6)-threonylcarbamoyltransferase complex ATPase subunit type 1 TsaE [Galbibacter sp. EGI 63066]
MTNITYSLNEIDKAAKEIIQKAGSKILLFYGEMGVGKTTLIKEIIKQLGSTDNISSPTYSLVNEYKGTNGPIFHFDFYRINTIDEAFDIGVEDYLYSNEWCLIEWPEKIEELLPNNATVIDIIIQLDGKRSMNVN